MKKTKIKYEDIKAGDLIQTVESAFGVKWELTGIAYEKIEHKLRAVGAEIDRVSDR